MLRPQENAHRELKSLVGLWKFRADADGVGRDEGWQAGPLAGAIDMPVPSSYNEITADPQLYNHVGDVWYQTTTYVPRSWADRRVVLRFDSATHKATVWVNDTEVMSHKGGYLPFEADVTALVTPGEQVRITAAVDNRLDWTTIPPGWIEQTPDGVRQKYFQDFFNFAGLHRPVHLYATAPAYVDDVTVRTDYDGRTGLVDYDVTVVGEGEVSVAVLDAEGNEVATGTGASGRVEIPEVRLWQPGVGYRYDLRISLAQDGEVVDTYDQKFGVRTVRVVGTDFLINDRPFYFRGFGMHEDHHVFGKGQHDASMVHDYNLLKWIGANSFRTSHYPYSEENMEYADAHGIVVIDETPAVGLNMGVSGGLFSANLEGEDEPGRSVTFRPDRVGEAGQAQHAQEIRELIARDKNRPSVVIWSIANEPESETQESADYFRPLFDVARDADPTRPVGFVNIMLAPAGACKVTEMADVVMVNRYYGWYVDSGDIPTAMRHLRAEITKWTELEKKPIIFTEFGADTMAGQHGLMGTMWTEEYQYGLMKATLEVFDEFPQVQGEQMWNFADFQTSAGIMRLDGNKKGAFTRDRRPKAVAHMLRKRWSAVEGDAKPTH